MSAPAFVDARLDTALIERERAHLFAPRAETTPAIWGQVALAFWRAQQANGKRTSTPQKASPWDDRRGWALGVRGERRWKFREGDVEREIAVRPAAEDPVANVVVRGHEIHHFLDGAHRQFQWLDPYLPATEGADAHGGLRASMPGRVLAVLVKAGDEVAKGAPLVVLEAMKLEQTITAPSAGKVDRVLCEVGEQVREGAELLALA
jgi:3-methylcrotonyl-CoA carboxylase alpha subunit